MKKYILFVMMLILSSVAYADYYCYQETANVSVSCGAVDTGNYSFYGFTTGTENQFIDGDWATGWTIDSGHLSGIIINYTKAVDSDSAYWILGSQGSTCFNGNTTILIPTGCFKDSVVMNLSVNQSDSGIAHIAVTCYNSTQWISIYNNTMISGSCEIVWEEGMNWFYVFESAPTMSPSPGYEYLTNTSNLNIIKAPIVGWQNAASGFAAFIMFLFVILLASTIVYVRTNNAVPTAFVTIILIWVTQYYGFMDIKIFGWTPNNIISSLFLLVVILLASWGVKVYLDK